jgi:hypothetical protein
MRFEAVLDYLRGQAVTIPPLDGAFRPNTALDEADVALEARAPDNLVFDGGRVLFTSGAEILALPAAEGGSPEALAHFDSPLAALAASPDGALAAGLDDGRVIVRGGPHDGRTLAPPEGIGCPTALAWSDPGTLLVCHGSAVHRPADWVVDLMAKNASGSLWRIDLASGEQTCLAHALAWPYGLLLDAAGRRLVVAESWRHRLLALPIANGATPEVILAKLPGYPARLSPAAGGGAWLGLFAPRNRLIEFVLLEDDYRAAMMREVPRDYWIAPALSSGASFLEPLQCGAVHTMGIHKPWAPSRSYGLIVRLDAMMRPVASLHSRSNGARHGVTSVVEAAGRLYAAAKGGSAILAIDGSAVGAA